MARQRPRARTRADGVNDLSPDIVWQLRQEGRMKVETAAGTDYAYIGMNLQDPALRRLEVRKAIGYAIDRDAIFQPDIRGVSLSPVADYAFLRHVYREPGGAAAAR